MTKGEISDVLFIVVLCAIAITLIFWQPQFLKSLFARATPIVYERVCLEYGETHIEHDIKVVDCKEWAYLEMN